jgi:hypothetical protein
MRVLGYPFSNNLYGIVGGNIVHHYDLMGQAGKGQSIGQYLQSIGDKVFLVITGNKNSDIYF